MNKKSPAGAFSTAILAATLATLPSDHAVAQSQGQPMAPSAGAAQSQVPQLVTTGLQYASIWPGSQVAATTVAPTQNTSRCAPFWVSVAYHADQAAISVTVAGTGPLNFAIYTDAIDATSHKHQPQTLITDPSLAFTVTGTGAQTVALGSAGVGVSIPAGLDWACVNDTTSADALRFTGLSPNSATVVGLIGATGAGLASGSSQLSSLTISQTAGSTTSNWPSYAGSTFAESNTTSVPTVALRIATVP